MTFWADITLLSEEVPLTRYLVLGCDGTGGQVTPGLSHRIASCRVLSCLAVSCRGISGQVASPGSPKLDRRLARHLGSRPAKIKKYEKSHNLPSTPSWTRRFTRPDVIGLIYPPRGSEYPAYLVGYMQTDISNWAGRIYQTGHSQASWTYSAASLAG